MYYIVPPSFFIGHKIGELICKMIGLVLMAIYYCAFAVLKILELLFKLFCYVLSKTEDLIVYAYRRFRKYREERYYVK